MSEATLAPGGWMVRDTEVTPVSTDGLIVSRLWSDRRNYRQGSAADWLPSIKAALDGIRSTCFAEGWGGDGEAVVEARTIEVVELAANSLFPILAASAPVPEVVPDSDGDISLNWTIDHRRIFSVSVGGDGIANFAGQFGDEGALHGWVRIDTSSRRGLERSLEEIARCIRKLFGAAVDRRAA